MAVWVLPIVLTILGILFAIGAIILMFYINRNTAAIDISPNAAMIDATTRTSFTDGYSQGLVKRAVPRKNGTILIEFYPTDIDQGDNKPMPQMQSLVVHKNMLKTLPKGQGSARREKYVILSRDPADLPELMRDTSYGEWMTREGQLKHMERVWGKVITMGDEAIDAMMTEWSRAGIARSTLSQIREEMNETRKMLGNKEPEEKK